MVEWKKIGDVCTTNRGVRVIKKDLSQTGEFPVIQNSITPMGFYHKNNYDRNTPYVITAGAAGEVGYSEVPFWAADDCLCIQCHENILPKFVFLWLQEKQFILKSQVRKGAIPRLSRTVVEGLVSPIPSLAEQERIVGVLDTFTKAIDNLKQQIELQRKKYAHYRDQLLDIEGKPSTDIHTWGEFSEMIKGNGVQKTDFVDEGIGCIHYGQIYTHYGSFTYSTNKFVSKETFDKARKASKGDIIMTDTSENVEDICKSVAYLGAEDIAVSNHALIIKHQQNPKFLSYSTLTRSFFNQKRKVVVGVKVSGIKPVHLAQIKIYLPSLSEQQRIVGILDRFEASISNMEQQLSERQKQYEYYRNKLLTFD